MVKFIKIIKPLTILPKDILLLIFTYLPLKNKIYLWQSCKRFNQIYFEILKKEIFLNRGYELGFEKKYQLTTFHQLKKDNNILLFGKCYLAKDLRIENGKNGFFIINDHIDFNCKRRS